QFLQGFYQAGELRRAEVRRGAAAEVEEVQRPAADDGQTAVQFHLPDEGIQVDLDVAGVLVGVDAEVAKFAAFAAKGNVQVQAQRRIGPGRTVQGGVGLGQELRLPGGKGRVVGDEVITEAGLFLSVLGVVNTRRHDAIALGYAGVAIRG